ncbi:MAG: hypothetical protein U1C33_03945 [Candidatus Cloacimonadaceae bacterium]|nr:hypothetical protein [Candidatus Cloacimonadaceae bacterium]
MRKACYVCIVLMLSFHVLMGTISFQYNARNEISQCSYGNGYVIDYYYDLNGNLTNLIITQPNVTPLSPTQFSITSNGDLKTLCWEPVTSNINGTPIIVPLYVIEASSDPATGFTLIGTTTQAQYTVSSYHYQHRFYRVRAVVNYQRDDTQPALQIDSITSETRSNK